MAKMPEIPGLAAAIDRAFPGTVELSPRAHLGASVIGQSCERRIWYTFRWAITENQFDGRMLRLFARGQREEQTFADLLRLVGCTVKTHNDDGKQFSFTEPNLGGHFGGSIDGMAHGIPEAPATWHVLEFKTHSTKSFTELAKKGVQKAKPEHYDQMQVYMRWTGLTRALYGAVNKNDDELYFERVDYDEVHAARLVDKAARIIRANTPPSKLSEDPAWHECKSCPFAHVCHGASLPSVNCRTCLHSTPVVDGSVAAAWHCARWDASIPLDESRKAMDCHRYIPPLVTYAQADDVDDLGNVVYSIGGVTAFSNGDVRPAYKSAEIRVMDPRAFCAELDKLREAFDATVVEA